MSYKKYSSVDIITAARSPPHQRPFGKWKVGSVSKEKLKKIYDASIILQREVEIHRVMRVYKRERQPSESKKEKIMLSCHYHGS